MADIFREIDEELRQEKAQQLWRAYGKYVIGGVAAIIVAVAGYAGWQQYETNQRLEAGAKFASAIALADESRRDEAAALFAALGKDSGTSYGVLARFNAAALKARSGDRKAASAAYRALAADDAVDPPLRDLARILAALNGLDGSAADHAALAADLKPLAAQGSAWRQSALELLGLMAQADGRTEEARSYFRRIADDVDAPRSVRARATEMLAVLDGK